MNDLKTDNELGHDISRLVDVLPEVLYRRWTEPGLLVKWVAPRPTHVDSFEYSSKVARTRYLLGMIAPPSPNLNTLAYTASEYGFLATSGF